MMFSFSDDEDLRLFGEIDADPSKTEMTDQQPLEGFPHDAYSLRHSPHLPSGPIDVPRRPGGEVIGLPSMPLSSLESPFRSQKLAAPGSQTFLSGNGSYVQNASTDATIHSSFPSFGAMNISEGSRTMLLNSTTQESNMLHYQNEGDVSLITNENPLVPVGQQQASNLPTVLALSESTQANNVVSSSLATSQDQSNQQGETVHSWVESHLQAKPATLDQLSRCLQSSKKTTGSPKKTKRLNSHPSKKGLNEVPEDERRRLQKQKDREYSAKSRQRKKDRLELLEKTNLEKDAIIEIQKSMVDILWQRVTGRKPSWLRANKTWYPSTAQRNDPPIKVALHQPRDDDGILKDLGNHVYGDIVTEGGDACNETEMETDTMPIQNVSSTSGVANPYTPLFVTQKYPPDNVEVKIETQQTHTVSDAEEKAGIAQEGQTQVSGLFGSIVRSLKSSTTESSGVSIKEEKGPLFTQKAAKIDNTMVGQSSNERNVLLLRGIKFKGSSQDQINAWKVDSDVDNDEMQFKFLDFADVGTKRSQVTFGQTNQANPRHSAKEEKKTMGKTLLLNQATAGIHAKPGSAKNPSAGRLFTQPFANTGTSNSIGTWFQGPLRTDVELHNRASTASFENPLENLPSFDVDPEDFGVDQLEIMFQGHRP